MSEALTSQAPASGAAHLSVRARPSATAWRFALSNLPFVLALAFEGLLPPLLQVLVVGSIIFLVPGLAWTDRRSGDACVVLFRVVVASSLASLAAWLMILMLPGPTSRVAFLVLLALFTNAGLWLGLRRGWYHAAPFNAPLPRMLSAVAALFFLQSFLGAAYFVPALEDQDMETQGTAYGLVHDLAPTMVTNRDTAYFFAHPLLLHLWIGESALISGDLERLHHFHEASIAARENPSQIQAQWAKEFARFQADPVLLPTRTPNLFLGALTLLPLGFLVFRLSGSQAAAIGACVIYATLPEIYVRTSYGGYLAVTNFLLTTGTYLYLHAAGLLPARSGIEDPVAPVRRSTWTAAFLGSWADQKFLLLPLAAPLHAGLRILLDLPALLADGWRDLIRKVAARPDFIAALLVGTGFAIGWASYALYGLTVAPADFIQDHLKTHIWWRLNKAPEVNLFRVEQGGFVYPSVVALWRQLADHTGWLLAPALLLGLWRAAPRVRQADGMLLIWALVGAIGFSLIDWRQTKHLAHIIPPLVILAAVAWASLEGRTRWAFGALIGAAVAWNLWRVGLLMSDFEYLKPLPIW